MIKVYNNPWLIDFLKVCAAMPQDEREQLEAFTGEDYSIDSAAIGNFTVQGPKWVVKDGDEPLAIFGAAQQRPGVWRDFMLNTPGVYEKHAFGLTRICRRAMNAMFESGQAHRVECVVPAARIDARPELVRWYGALGYTREATLLKYCANGDDAVLFARVS